MEWPCSGHASASENRCSPAPRPPVAPEDCPPASPVGLPSASSTCTSTRPSASLHASSTASAMRLVALSFSCTRSTTTSMKCLIFLFRVSGSPSSFTISPSTRTREKPSFCRSANSLVNSPLRPATTGAMTMAFASGASARISSVTWSVVCFFTGRPHSGQCGTPTRANKQAQVVVYLGGGAHGGARVLAGGLLVDGHGRRQAVDAVQVGLVHLPQEHARVAGEALHVAALPFGVHGVEGQAGLARARKPREHDQLVARYGEVDVLQVVLACAFDDDGVLSHRCSSFGPWFRERIEATGQVSFIRNHPL